MALSTHSKFYYGLRVDSSSKYLDFKEGSNTFKAEISVGSYTGSKLANEIKKQMELVGAGSYSVGYNRVTRVFTISSSTSFDLLCLSGVSSGSSVFKVIGFNQSSDKTGSSSYASDNQSGKEYKTQFHLQSYKSTNSNKKAIDGQVQESSSGVVEVVKTGNKKFMSCEFMYISNINYGPGHIFRYVDGGVDKFIDLMEWLTEKYFVEFMPDENKPNEYQTFILESTEQDQKGLDYELIELYGIDLPEHFRSGALKFRLME